MTQFLKSSIIAAALVLAACNTTKPIEDILNAADTDHVAVWTGFEHAWQGQNHRVNRIGSFVGEERCQTNQDCRYEIVHTAASGSDPDTANFSTRYLVMRAANVAFQGARIQFDLTGVEEERISFDKILAITAEPRFFNKQKNMEAVLSGFDLLALSKSKKLGHFSVSVGEPSLTGTDQISIPVSGSLDLDCDTLECILDDSTVVYRVTLFVVLIGGTESSAAFTPQSATTTSYSFEAGGTNRARTEIHESDFPGIERVLAKSGSDAHWGTFAVLAKGISIDVLKTLNVIDRSLHLLEWNSFLNRGSNTSEGIESIGKLWYKSWKADSWFNAGSLEEPGTVTLSMTPLVAQFLEGSVLECSRNGALRWNKPENTSADTSDAKSVEIFELKSDRSIACRPSDGIR